MKRLEKLELRGLLKLPEKQEAPKKVSKKLSLTDRTEP